MPNTTHVLGNLAALWCAAVLMIACGDGRRSLPVALPDGAVLEFDAAMIPPIDAGMPRDLGVPRDLGGPLDLGRDGGGSDSGLGPLPEVDGVVSSPAGMRWAPLNPADCVDLVSSNFTEQRYGTSVLREWYAEIRNVCSYTVCTLLVDAEFRTASGTPFSTITGVPNAPAYEYGTTYRSETGCLAYDVHAGLYGNESGVVSDPLVSAATSGIWSGGGIRIASAFPTGAVVMTGSGWAVPSDGVGDWAYGGTIRAVESLHNMMVTVYPITDRGIIEEDAKDFHLNALYAATTWNYEAGTLFGVPRPTRQIAPVVSFLFGAAVLGPDATDEERAAARQETLLAGVRDQQQTRLREFAALGAR